MVRTTPPDTSANHTGRGRHVDGPLVWEVAELQVEELVEPPQVVWLSASDRGSHAAERLHQRFHVALTHNVGFLDVVQFGQRSCAQTLRLIDQHYESARINSGLDRSGPGRRLPIARVRARAASIFQPEKSLDWTKQTRR